MGSITYFCSAYAPHLTIQYFGWAPSTWAATTISRIWKWEYAEPQLWEFGQTTSLLRLGFIIWEIKIINPLPGVVRIKWENKCENASLGGKVPYKWAIAKDPSFGILLWVAISFLLPPWKAVTWTSEQCHHSYWKEVRGSQLTTQSLLPFPWCRVDAGTWLISQRPRFSAPLALCGQWSSSCHWNTSHSF